MIYTLLLISAARALGYRIMLQHHSYAYLLRRSRLLAVLIRVGGARVVHLVTAPQMQTDFSACYPSAETRVVGIAQDLPLVEAVPTSVARERLVLGFLGNVTVEKGIGLALDTVRAASRAGMSIELRVAGPIDAAASELLADTDTGLVTLLGPIYGDDRDAFLDGIDVFLFPSQYSHESFGLAAWEAMARGRPLVAHRSGCLTADAVGRGGLIIERTDDFAVHAVPVLKAWSSNPGTLVDTGRWAHASAASMVSTSRKQIEHLCLDLVRLAADEAAVRVARR